MINRAAAILVYLLVVLWLAWLCIGLRLWKSMADHSDSLFVGVVQIGSVPRLFVRSVTPIEFAFGVLFGVGFAVVVFWLSHKPFIGV